MKPSLDPEREERIEEIIVDAADLEEQAMSWYCHLDETLAFPFSARWGSDTVEILSMASGDDCDREMFVMVRYQGKTGDNTVVARLQDIQLCDAIDEEMDEELEETRQAVEDWHYWVARGRV